MIKRLIIEVLLFLVSANICHSQNQFVISQYYQSQAMYNPAFTGIDGFLDMKLGYRTKWTGLNSSPVSTFLSGYSVIGDNTLYNLSPLRISNPNQIEYIETQKNRMKSHGIGGFVNKQSQGAYSNIDFMINYAYHIPMNENIKIAIGTSIGFSNTKIDFSKIDVWDKTNDLVYQSYLIGQSTYWRFKVNIGGVIYGNNSYLGISYLPVVDLAMNKYMNELIPEKSFVATSGTKFKLSRNLEFHPSILIELSKPTLSRIIGSFQLDIYNWVKTGVIYSSNKELALTTSINYKNDFSISYAFETSIGGEYTIGNGTHEIILSVSFFNHLRATHRLW